MTFDDAASQQIPYLKLSIHTSLAPSALITIPASVSARLVSDDYTKQDNGLLSRLRFRQFTSYQAIPYFAG